MEKLFIKEKLSNFLIVEGFWQTGKSKIIKSISDAYNYNIIDEPNHLSKKINKDISTWYYLMHRKRIRSILKKKKINKKIIMERSVISSIAYYYAKTGKVTNIHKRELKNINKIKNLIIIFLYTDKNFAEKRFKDIKDNTVKYQIHNNPFFYKNYLYFYNKILPQYINKIIKIKTNHGRKFYKCSKIIERLLLKIKEIKKNKKICASSVLFHKRDILLLYDCNYRHFVLPQGHKKNKERLRETAIRESIEETGYNNLEIIKKIKKYQYSYHVNKEEKIYKNITTYLVKIINLSKTKKRLESHEKYYNKFFPIKIAIKKLKWSQDKKSLIEAQKYIK